MAVDDRRRRRRPGVVPGTCQPFVQLVARGGEREVVCAFGDVFSYPCAVVGGQQAIPGRHDRRAEGEPCLGHGRHSGGCFGRLGGGLRDREREGRADVAIQRGEIGIRERNDGGGIEAWIRR